MKVNAATRLQADSGLSEIEDTHIQNVVKKIAQSGFDIEETKTGPVRITFRPRGKSTMSRESIVKPQGLLVLSRLLSALESKYEIEIFVCDGYIRVYFLDK
jgi:hypothetical protein